jgi:thiamine-monophosphate kinase
MESAQQYTSIQDIGEFGLIGHLRSVLGESNDDSVLAGISDDAAVYRIDDERVHVLTTDAMIEGIHFDRTFMPMEHLGFKAISINVSDIVAMNAEPRYATVTLGVPQQVPVEALGQLYEGIAQACRAYGMTVVGGDTTAAHQFTLSVSVVGEAHEEDIVYRSGAQPGDVLCVTGDLGASFAGLKALVENREQLQEKGEENFQPNLDRFNYVIQRHLAPPAQLKAIRDWAEHGIRPHALIDISDGLASEVNHICEASGVGALVHSDKLPLAQETMEAAKHFGEDVDVYALFGGEDYELLFALPEEELDKLSDLPSDAFFVVGTVTEKDEGVLIEQPSGETVPLRPGGFDHFRADDANGGGMSA